MPGKKKKKIMHSFKMDEISGVDGMAQAGAKVVIMKRDDSGEDLLKAMFNDALESLELQESIDDALREMWKHNEALRISIRDIVNDKETYPDTMSAVSQSLQEFAVAVSSMIEGAIGEIEEEAAETLTKTEDGKTLPATDFAYVLDPENPSTWRLRMTKSGETDLRTMEALSVVLDPVSKIQSVQIPEDQMPEVLGKVRKAWLTAHPDKTEEDLPKVLIMKESSMTPEEKKAQDEALSKAMKEKDDELEKVNADLTIAKAIGELTDVEKAHFNSLDDEGKSTFLKATPEIRKADLEKAAEKDSVIYTDTEGMEYRKSDDPRLAKMARKADEDRKIVKAEREKRETLELEKRATEDLGNLPGESKVKVAVLKALDSIEDAEVKKSAVEMLKAHNESFRTAFEERGSRGEGFQKATDALDSMAKKHAADNSVSYAKAYDAVIQTDDGKKLYEQTLS